MNGGRATITPWCIR